MYLQAQQIANSKTNNILKACKKIVFCSLVAAVYQISFRLLKPGVENKATYYAIRPCVSMRIFMRNS